tara:strand:- start:1482 stop:2174 length:693 start_codon:yes stop_codon:yes gene_type:complete
MSTIAQLGRMAAQQMMKQAIELPTAKTQQPGFGAPLREHDLAQSSMRHPSLPRGAPDAAASGRAKYRNVPVPGGGGSMWGDQVAGRGGAHPDSPWANEMINSAFGAGRGPIGQPFAQQQDTQSKRLLAQDPRGRGGWAYTGTKTHAQQKAESRDLERGRRMDSLGTALGGNLPNSARYLEQMLEGAEAPPLSGVEWAERHSQNPDNAPYYGSQGGHRLMEAPTRPAAPGF